MHFICFVVIFVGFAINVYCCAQLYQIMLKTDNANCSLGVIAIRRILKETVHIFQSNCNSAHFFLWETTRKSMNYRQTQTKQRSAKLKKLNWRRIDECVSAMGSKMRSHASVFFSINTYAVVHES